MSPLSIIVPALNEASVIGSTLVALAPLQLRGAQLIVVDGGSTDSTVATAHAAGATVIVAPKGRALQMNAGVQHANGATLLFLHADTALPECADLLVTQVLAGGVHAWGRFDVHIHGTSAWLKVIATMINWRSRYTGVATGDQALFMTRTAFDAVGGFPIQPLMEDIEMSQRLITLSRPACLRARVVTSGRRWETRGVWRTVLLMWQLRLAYWRGASPELLAKRYR